MNNKLTEIYNKIIDYIEIRFNDYLSKEKEIRIFIVSYLFALYDNQIINKDEYIELINVFSLIDLDKYE